MTNRLEFQKAQHPKQGAPFDVKKHTDSPLRYEGVAQLDAPPERVFEFISNPRQLPKWLAMLNTAQMDHATSESPGTCGVGSTRHCNFRGMGDVEEEILWWDAPHGYAFKFTKKSNLMMPTSDHVLVWRTDPDGGGGTLFKSQVYFNWRGVIMRHLAAPMMTKLLDESVRNLQREFGGAGGKAKRVG